MMKVINLISCNFLEIIGIILGNRTADVNIKHKSIKTQGLFMFVIGPCYYPNNGLYS